MINFNEKIIAEHVDSGEEEPTDIITHDWTDSRHVKFDSAVKLRLNKSNVRSVSVKS